LPLWQRAQGKAVLLVTAAVAAHGTQNELFGKFSVIYK
jgi:hypothetical protein